MTKRISQIKGLLTVNDLDLSCAVNWCTTIPTDRRSGIYCSNHAKYKVKYGTPTPIVDCYGCASKIEAPKAFSW